AERRERQVPGRHHHPSLGAASEQQLQAAVTVPLPPRHLARMERLQLVPRRPLLHDVLDPDVLAPDAERCPRFTLLELPRHAHERPALPALTPARCLTDENDSRVLWTDAPNDPPSLLEWSPHPTTIRVPTRLSDGRSVNPRPRLRLRRRAASPSAPSSSVLSEAAPPLPLPPPRPRPRPPRARASSPSASSSSAAPRPLPHPPLPALPSPRDSPPPCLPAAPCVPPPAGAAPTRQPRSARRPRQSHGPLPGSTSRRGSATRPCRGRAAW